MGWKINYATYTVSVPDFLADPAAAVALAVGAVFVACIAGALYYLYHRNRRQ